MKRAISGDLVFSPSGNSYDRVRILLGKGYQYRNGRVAPIESRVDVVEESVFSSIEDSPGSTAIENAPQNPFIPEIGETIPAGGIDAIFSGSVFVETPNGDLIPSGGPTGTQAGSRIPGTRLPDLRDYGQRSEVVDVGGTTLVPLSPLELVGSLRPVEIQQRTGSMETPSVVPTLPPIDLSVPAVPQSDFDNIVQIEGGDANQPEVYLPPLVLDLNDDDVVAENLPFRPRLSIWKANTDHQTGWSEYLCKVSVPGLVAKAEQTGESNRTILQNLSDFPQVSQEIVYLLAIKGALEEIVDTTRLFIDYQMAFNLSDTDDPHTSDAVVGGVYNFFDKKFEQGTWTREINKPNFYYMGRTSGNFETKNIDYMGAGGTNFSEILTSHSAEETALYNDYFAAAGAVPFGASIESDVDFCKFLDLVCEHRLLKQFGMNLVNPNRYLTRFVDTKNILIESGEVGAWLSADIMWTKRWLESLYTQEAPLFTPDDVGATVFSLLPIAEIRGAEQNPVLKAVGAKNVLIQSERMNLSGTRGLVDCLNNRHSDSERAGLSISKNKRGAVQKIISLFGRSGGMRTSLFDSQVFYGEPYNYDVSSIYNIFANEYYYQRQSDRPTFDVEDLSVYFKVKMRPTIISTTLPNFTKPVQVVSAIPNAPSVSIEQYRDLKTTKNADVIFMLRNVNETFVGDFIPVFEEDFVTRGKLISAFGHNKIPTKNDDPIIKFEVLRTTEIPTSYQDFADAKMFVLDNRQQVSGEQVILDANTFVDSLNFNQDYYYIFRQVDIHGMVSNPTNIFQVRIVPTGQRYRVLTREWTIEEFVASSKQKTNVFKPTKRFVCVVPKEEHMKKMTSFSKQYRLKLVSTKSRRVLSVDFEVKMASNSEIE